MDPGAEDDRTPLLKPSLAYVKKKWETHQTPAAIWALMKLYPWATIEETGLGILERSTLEEPNPNPNTNADPNPDPDRRSSQNGGSPLSRCRLSAPPQRQK